MSVWLLDRQIGRIGAAKNFIHIGARSPKTGRDRHILTNVKHCLASVRIFQIE
jgi:hypothetical protein